MRSTALFSPNSLLRRPRNWKGRTSEVGLFVKYRLERFLETWDEQGIADSARALLSSFFQVVGASSISYRSAALAHTEAAQVLAARLVSLPPIADGGTGLAFQFATPAKNKWHLFLNREVVPRVELRAFVGEVSRISRHNAQRFVRAADAHLFHSSGLYGRPVDLYLSFKMSQLRHRGIHVRAPNGGENAAIRFRQVCNEIWRKSRPDDVAPRWRSWWHWRFNRFIRAYDKLLFRGPSADELRTILFTNGPRRGRLAFALALKCSLSLSKIPF